MLRTEEGCRCRHAAIGQSARLQGWSENRSPICKPRLRCVSASLHTVVGRQDSSQAKRRASARLGRNRGCSGVQETLIYSASGMKCKESGAQSSAWPFHSAASRQVAGQARHIMRIGELSSTARRSNSPAQPINQRLLKENSKPSQPGQLPAKPGIVSICCERILPEPDSW